MSMGPWVYEIMGVYGIMSIAPWVYEIMSVLVCFRRWMNG